MTTVLTPMVWHYCWRCGLRRATPTDRHDAHDICRCDAAKIGAAPPFPQTSGDA